MTILLKDWQNVFQAVTAPTTSNLASVSTAIYETNEAYVGSAIPVIQDYPETSVTTSNKDIRVATALEVEALKISMFSGTPEPLRTTYFNQLLYNGNYGIPLKTYSATSFIAAWYGNYGMGFYVFIGYDPNNPPTQTISAESIQRV